MGTRHLTAVYIDGAYKVAQYGQWDGYPGGQGKTVIEFLHRADRKAFMEKCRATRYISQPQLEDLWVECGAVRGESFVNLQVSDRFNEKYAHLDREVGAKVLETILEREPGIWLVDSISFAGDSLFCEWAYVIDYDKNLLEVYKGFNKVPLQEGDRFLGFEGNPKYEPIKLHSTWDLNFLPSVEDFLSYYESKEEE